MKNTGPQSNPERMDTYWICVDCAKKRNMVFPKHPVTVTIGLCGHCDREDESTLIPIVDFGENPIWD